MPLLSSRHDTKYEAAWKDVVAAVRKGFFKRDQGKIEPVGQDMKTKDSGWNVSREKHVNKIRKWMVVVRREGVRGKYTMLPRSVIVLCGRGFRMQGIIM